MPTQGHSATGYTRARDSVRVASRSVHGRACVHCALSAGVCMWSVGTLFRARGNDATVGVQRSASTAPVRKGSPSAIAWPTLPTRPYSCLLLSTTSRAGRGFAEIPSDCAADLLPVPLKRERNSAFQPSRHPPQYQKVRAPCAAHNGTPQTRPPQGRPPRPSPTAKPRSPEQVKLRQDLLREREQHHEGGGQWRVPD